jgi:hypothetical protein
MGAFSIGCPRCPNRSKPFKNVQAFLSHCGSKHKHEDVKIGLASPCHCKGTKRFTAVRSIFDHVLMNHMNLLVQVPSVSSSGQPDSQL